VDETSTFFLRDAKIRLSRSVELALAYALFVFLLYIRFLAPISSSMWSWYEVSGTWVLNFLPLFAMDYRNFKHITYLSENAARFVPHDSKRYMLIVFSECSYKVLLCAYLSIVQLRAQMSLQFVMLPYTAGYILHFVLGHFVPLEEGERAEGCNAVASLLSELGRFLQFVLVVSMSLKVDKVSKVAYDWQAAFWPCWGLEGIIILVVVLLLPVCLVSVIVDRPRMLMLTWIVVSAVGLGVSSFMSMYYIANLLDNSLCPETPCEDAEVCKQCQQHLENSFIPWLIFLPVFAIITTFFKERLACSLHTAWYQAAPEAQARAQREDIPELPTPVVMFRVTPTYFSRACDPTVLDIECGGPAGTGPTSVVPEGSGKQSITGSPSLMASPAGSVTHASMNHGSMNHGSMASTYNLTRSLDHATSIMTARGAMFADIVESEQLCYVCFDEPPGAVLLECGHAGMCVTCAAYLLERPARQAKCPICRAPISNALRLRPELSVPKDLFTRGNTSGHSDAKGGGALASGLGASIRSGQAAPLNVSSPGASLDCDPERGDYENWTASLGARGGRNSRLMMQAQAAAEACGQPLAAPPWPEVARRHAIMVESLRRPPSRPGWQIASLLRSHVRA
jgi:hypothetical protein